MTFLMLILGLLFLLVGGTALVSGASGLATRLGISPLVVGLTVVAFGTSAPELVVNILGALRGETALAVGNVIGSNLANLGLVLGSAAVVRPFVIEGQIVRRELPLLLLATCILAVMTLDRALQYGEPILSRGDGIILLLLFSIFIYVSVTDFLRSSQDKVIKDVIEMEQTIPGNFLDKTTMDWVLTAGGIAGLAFGGHLTIIYGSTLAAEIGVSPTVIGLLVVAIGTSMPEMVTSIIAALRNEADLCVGNVVGSNIFNSLFVLPISALVRPLPIPEGILGDIVLSLVFAAILIPIFLFGRERMNRSMGVLFLASYVVYMVYRTTV
jgi:cation:H+ antiporter